MNLGSLSICCVVKNEEKYIKDLVDSILKVFKGNPEVELIFVIALGMSSEDNCGYMDRDKTR